MYFFHERREFQARVQNNSRINHKTKKITSIKIKMISFKNIRVMNYFFSLDFYVKVLNRLKYRKSYSGEKNDFPLTYIANKYDLNQS